MKGKAVIAGSLIATSTIIGGFCQQLTNDVICGPINRVNENPDPPSQTLTYTHSGALEALFVSGVSIYQGTPTSSSTTTTT